LGGIGYFVAGFAEGVADKTDAEEVEGGAGTVNGCCSSRVKTSQSILLYDKYPA